MVAYCQQSAASLMPEAEEVHSAVSADPASQSGRRRRRLRFQAKGLLHRFEAVALEAEAG